MEESKKINKILLVDDDSFLLDMYSVKFKGAGYEIVTATGADECIEKIKGGFDPDIFIFDLIMPKMNGIELFKNLKNNNFLKNSVNIVLTNQGKATDLKDVEDLNIDGYIVKALHTPSEVLEKVNEIFNKKHQ